MPSGAKKRKALKKKKEQEAVGASTSNKGNGHGYNEHGSQDEGESDGSLCSPCSQGNGEFWTRESSPSPLSGLGKDTVKEKTEDADLTQGQGAKGEDVVALGRGTGHEENGVDKSPNFFPENVTHNTRIAASQEADDTTVLEIAPAVNSVKPVDSSVSKVLISDKNKHVESSTDSDSFQQKSDESKEKRRLEEAKEGNVPGASAETSKEVKSMKEAEVPEYSEEKDLKDKYRGKYSANSGQQKLEEQPAKQDTWCNLESVMAEIYQILRPEGTLIIRDDMETIGEVEKMVKSMKWNVKVTQSKDNDGLLSMQKSWWRPTETETIKWAIA